MITKKCIYFVMGCLSINRVLTQTPPKVPQLFLPNPSLTAQPPPTQPVQKTSDVPLTIKALTSGLPKSTQCGSCTETLSNIVQFLMARDVQKASTSTISKDVEETKAKLMQISKQSVLDSASNIIREILERNYNKQAAGQTIYTNNPAAALISKPKLAENLSNCVKLTFTPNGGVNYAGNPIQPIASPVQAIANLIQPLAITSPIQNIGSPLQTLANPLQSLSNGYQPSSYLLQNIANPVQPIVNPVQSNPDVHYIRPNPVQYNARYSQPNVQAIANHVQLILNPSQPRSNLGVQYVRQNPLQYNVRYTPPNINQYPIANQNRGYINNSQRPRMYTNICGSLPVINESNNNEYLNKRSAYVVNDPRQMAVPHSRCGKCISNQCRMPGITYLYGQKTV